MGIAKHGIMTIRGLGGDVYIRNRKTANCFKVQNSYSFVQLLFYLKLKTERLKTAQQIRKKIFFSGIVFLFKTGNLAART